MQVRLTHTDVRAHQCTCPTLSVLLSEPLGGVVEGLSAVMFLIGITVPILSLLVYRQRLRKV